MAKPPEPTPTPMMPPPMPVLVRLPEWLARCLPWLVFAAAPILGLVPAHTVAFRVALVVVALGAALSLHRRK
jgi:hypothetical protein